MHQNYDYYLHTYAGVFSLKQNVCKQIQHIKHRTRLVYLQYHL